MQNNSSRVEKFGSSKRKQRAVMEEGSDRKDNRKRNKPKRQREEFEYDQDQY